MSLEVTMTTYNVAEWLRAGVTFLLMMGLVMLLLVWFIYEMTGCRIVGIGNWMC